jgi:hypothetical protein
LFQKEKTGRKIKNKYVNILIFINLLKKFFYSFIHMFINCLGHSSPLPLALSLSPHPSLLPGRTCSALIFNFVEEKT